VDLWTFRDEKLKRKRQSMMLRKSLALLVLLQSTIAFVAPSMQPSHRASTWLAEGEGGDSTDILNSPSFLQRKLEVLKSDIEQAEKDLEEAQALAAAGKEEWKPQLDDLRKEVRFVFCCMSEGGTKPGRSFRIFKREWLVRERERMTKQP